jgi:hypothetical protein
MGNFVSVRKVRIFGWVTRVLPFGMITIKGKEHRTIENAAEEFGVSTKTVHSWIKNGIINQPPQMDYGLRKVQIFPESYMRDARKQVEAYRQGQRIEPTRKSTRPSA